MINSKNRHRIFTRAPHNTKLLKCVPIPFQLVPAWIVEASTHTEKKTTTTRRGWRIMREIHLYTECVYKTNEAAEEVVENHVNWLWEGFRVFSIYFAEERSQQLRWIEDYRPSYVSIDTLLLHVQQSMVFCSEDWAIDQHTWLSSSTPSGWRNKNFYYRCSIESNSFN